MTSRRFCAEAFGTFWLVFAGPITGASMNPARSLAPAIVSMQLGSVWIYLVAPIAGAVASVPLWRCMRRSAGGETLESEGCG